MKKVAIAMFVGLLLAGCSQKGTVIPSDPAKWDKISSAAKGLNDEDRRLLGGYMARQTLSAAFGGKGGIPPGTTIGQAITDQKKFEADAKRQEAEADALKAKVLAQRAAAAAAIQGVATVTLVSKNFLPRDFERGRFDSLVSFVIAVQNKGAKDIDGIKGVMVFDDLFGTQIKRVSLSMDTPVKGGTMISTDRYSIQVNQFDNDDTKIAMTDLAKMKVTFEPEMVVFADKTTMGVPPDSNPG